MNTFGKNFRVTTYGESHGGGIGAVIDGCPPGISLTGEEIQQYLDKRRPGSSDLVTPRKESDQVEILSGVFEGKTIGTPIGLLIRNEDMRSKDYESLMQVFRPGHADRAYTEKFGVRDYRGGGRSSGRETAARVAAGAIARICLISRGILITGVLKEVHGVSDPSLFEEEIRSAQAMGNSVGGIIEVQVHHCPPGLGDPVFGRLDAMLSGALMGIGGVKAVEIGDGFRSARLFGSENNDSMTSEGYGSNHAGGILGGISTGQEIIVRIGVKPTPSIGISQQTISCSHEDTSIIIKGRHDPCIAIRIVPVAEAMTALVIMDALLEQDRYLFWRENSQG